MSAHDNYLHPPEAGPELDDDDEIRILEGILLGKLEDALKLAKVPVLTYLQEAVVSAWIAELVGDGDRWQELVAEHQERIEDTYDSELRDAKRYGDE